MPEKAVKRCHIPDLTLLGAHPQARTRPARPSTPQCQGSLELQGQASDEGVSVFILGFIKGFLEGTS